MNWNQYLARFFGVIDTMDAKSFSHWFSENGSFKFANQEPAVGRAAIVTLAQGVFDQLGGIGHRVVNTASNPESHLFVEGVVTYHRKDGKKIELPFACVLEFDPQTLTHAQPMIQKYRSYVDVAPLMQS